MSPSRSPVQAMIHGVFPGGSVVKNPILKQEMQVQSLGWEDPLEPGTSVRGIFQARVLEWVAIA